MGGRPDRESGGDRRLRRVIGGRRRGDRRAGRPDHSSVDGRPGAHEAGVVFFIDKALATFNAGQKKNVRRRRMATSIGARRTNGREARPL